MNLGYVLGHFLNVEPKAKKKFQQYNWMRRPIQKDALEYALEDVRYLFDLKTALLKELGALDLLDEYEKNNRAVQETYDAGLLRLDRPRRVFQFR